MKKFLFILMFFGCLLSSRVSFAQKANVEFWETYDAWDLRQIVLQNYASSKDRKKHKKQEIDVLAIYNEILNQRPKPPISVIMFMGERIHHSELATVAIADTAKINQQVAEISAFLPEDLVLAWESPLMIDKGYLSLVCLKKTDNKGCFFSVSKFNSAEVFQSPYGNYSVYVKLDRSGAKQFDDITLKCVNKQIAIVINNEVFSLPRVICRIDSGGFPIFYADTRAQAQYFKDTYIGE